MNWRIEYDEKSNKIVRDEATEDDRCRIYYYVNGGNDTEGIGVVDKTREKCVEKLLKELRSDIRELRKELKEKQRLFDELEISLY